MTASAQEEPSLVVNLSGVTHTKPELDLLSKGLSFCPTPARLNTEAVRDDLERSFRRLRLKEFFLEENEDDDINNIDTSPPSIWMPLKSRDAALEIYIKQPRR